MAEKDLITLVNSSVTNKRNELIFSSSNVFKGKRINNKNIILNYLKSFTPSWFSSTKVIDNITNAQINKLDNIYQDDFFEWSETDIYHFEKYDMTLKDEFINYVLSKLNRSHS